MGFLSKLFGGGRKEKPAVTSVVDRPLPEWMPYYEELARGAQQAYRENLNARLPNQLVAGFDPLQVQAQNELAGPAAGAIRNYADLLFGTNRELIPQLLDPNSELVQGAISAAVDPIFRKVSTELLPAVRGSAMLTGNVGSSRQGVAEGLIGEASMREAGNIGARMANDAYQRGLQAYLRILGLAPETAKMAAVPGLIESGVGQQRQQQAQAELEAKNAQETFSQDARDIALANYANILFGLPGGMSQTTAMAARGGGGGLQSAIGLGLQGARLGSVLGVGSAVGGGVGLLAGLLL